MPTGDRLAAILLLLFGVFVSRESRELAYWTANAPGPGFLPFWLGVLLALSAAAILARASAAAGARPHPGRAPEAVAWGRVAALLGLTTAACAAGLVIGFVPAVGVFIGVTLTYLRPGAARANWTIASIAPAIVWLVFVRWLAVPLPAGPFGF